MCNEAVAQFSYALRHVPDHLKTQEMCDEAMRNNPAVLFLVPDHFKTEEMCIKALEVDPLSLYDIPDNLKTSKICNKAVEDDSFLLQYVLDWFVKREWMWMWFDDYYDDDGDHWDNDDDEDKFFEWYDGYKKRRTRKAKIKSELLPIAWHPNHVMNWCMSEDEKGVWK